MLLIVESDDATPHVPTTWDRLVAWLPQPRDYRLTRWLVLRLLGVVYVFAFIGLICQGPALLGSHGLTPVADYVARLHEQGLTAWDVPSLFMWGPSDGALVGWAYVGLAVALAVMAGYANLPMLILLWVIYGSYERVGQLWFSFGWEIQILETTLIAAFLAHPWDPRPLAARAPPTTAIVLMRWLTFRIMLGAGLIKIRGDACWHELTCLDAHFETQPIPNPLSAWFHAAPHAVHAVGVVFNHFVELVCPWLIFGPRRVRLFAAICMATFQLVLVASGNLAFLNWLTLVPVLACFDDDALRTVLPRRLRMWLDRPLAGTAPARWPHRIACYVFAALVAIKSIDVVENLVSHHQAMNRSYDRLELVNTYGAFGSVGDTRHELVIEGTLADDPTSPSAEWRAYELPCKPGDVARRPCLLGPYHRRLDWLIWFAAMDDEPREAWVLHLVWKLLDGDVGIRNMLGRDPFDGTPPKWVRIRRFVYHLAPPLADTWWTRDDGEDWLPPLSRDSQALRDTLARFGWPSPTLR
jgi:hypothetical protein